LSVGRGRPAASVSEGTSQYGLSAVRDWFALADECRSAGTPMIDNFSIAPSCSCDALIAFNMLLANHAPATKNKSWITRLARGYQLSLMSSPWGRLQATLRKGRGKLLLSPNNGHVLVIGRMSLTGHKAQL